MVGAFPITATLMFLFLFVIWRRIDWFNATLKLIFIVLAIWGGFESLHALGYIVQVAHD